MEHCPSLVESSLHIFHDCPLTVEVWNIIVDHDSRIYNLDINNWVYSNLTNSFLYSCSFTWNRIWAMVCSSSGFGGMLWCIIGISDVHIDLLKS